MMGKMRVPKTSNQNKSLDAPLGDKIFQSITEDGKLNISFVSLFHKCSHRRVPNPRLKFQH